MLTSYKKIETERSIANLYHLLTGRRSIQTIQDAELYQLQNYYGIYRSLSKKRFDQFIKELVNKGFLFQEVERLYTTKQTDDWIQKQIFIEKELYFKGHLFHSLQDVFYARLLLMIQVWTNSQMKNNSYMPVVEDRKVEQWVKQTYMQTKGEVHFYLTELHHELVQILQTVSNRQANLFVDRLTGYQTFGLSIEQLSQQYNMLPTSVYLHLISVIHQIIYLTHKNKQHFPILHLFLIDLLNEKTLSKTAQQTNQLLKNGLSVKQIAQKRHLTKNTIYDHLVEIALQSDEFPYEQFITKKQIDLVIDIVQKIKTFRLKKIKKHVPDEMTYFQIRLILTKFNEIDESL